MSPTTENRAITIADALQDYAASGLRDGLPQAAEMQDAARLLRAPAQEPGWADAARKARDILGEIVSEADPDATWRDAAGKDHVIRDMIELAEVWLDIRLERLMGENPTGDLALPGAA